MLVLTCHLKYWMELKDYFTANLWEITAQEGPALSFVGLNIDQHKDHITVNRRGYIEKLIAKKDPKDISSTATLYPLHLNTLESLSNSVSLPEHALTPAIMELRYLDDVRPDIEFATAFLTQNMSKPTVAFARHVKQLLDYLASTLYSYTRTTTHHTPSIPAANPTTALHSAWVPRATLSTRSQPPSR